MIFLVRKILGIKVGHLLGLIPHVAYRLTRIDDSDTRPIAHQYRVQLEVDDHRDFEDAAAILILLDELLAVMEWLGQNVFALLLGCPELDGSWRIVNVLAHANDIIEEMLTVKLRVFLKRYIQGGATETILSKARLYSTKSFLTEPKRNHLFLYSFRRYG